MQFKIEQVAIAPRLAVAAKRLLTDMGLAGWTEDTVKATGTVGDRHTSNMANLSFNYEASNGALEFEILEYTFGDNWLRGLPSIVSHLGMHCTAEELDQWKRFFADRGIAIAQEVFTDSHTNQFLVDCGRKYNYCIFDTRQILGTEIKMIVRIDP